MVQAVQTALLGYICDGMLTICVSDVNKELLSSDINEAVIVGSDLTVPYNRRQLRVYES